MYTSFSLAHMRFQFCFRTLLSFILTVSMIGASLAPSLRVLAQEVDDQVMTEAAVLPETVASSDTLILESSGYPLAYPAVMRRYAAFARQEKDPVLSGDIEQTREVAAELKSSFLQFRDEELTHLKKFNIPAERVDAYMKRLDAQYAVISPAYSPQIYTEITGLPMLDELSPQEERNDLKRPDHPADFRVNTQAVSLRHIQDIKTSGENQQAFSSLIATEQLPTLPDVTADQGREVVMTPQIQELADSLGRNPVNIFNFLRNTVEYEPYFGSKKGALGCLRSRVCNDTDTASLGLSLLRASGVPARYHTSAVQVDVDLLKTLLGVEETKTVYALLTWNNIPIGVPASAPPISSDFDNYDFSAIDAFILEWTRPEVFVAYDERGANVLSPLDFSEATDDAQVRDILQADPSFFEMQWIDMEVLMATPYTRAEREIIANTANFDTEAFWYDFFQYQGTLTPLEKYAADLLVATGKDISDPLYQSRREKHQSTRDHLPFTQPYLSGSGAGKGVTIADTHRSVLWPSHRQQVVITVKMPDDTVVLTHSFFGNEIDNHELNLFYEGRTASDQAVIESYGGIHATPAELVNIVPSMSSEFVRFEGTGVTVGIGDQLILQFEYLLNGELITTDQKFSVAGNHEGIYISLSEVADTPLLDTNSKILLEGNAALAREYLRRVEESGNLLEKALDVQHNVNFSRAVVTQNRVLSRFQGVPTTFDFQGLSVDAFAYINGASNRGNYQDRTSDFYRLWGQELSYQEARFFEDIAGLKAISTVTGLQHAYANPEQYTVHVIDSNNKSVIDSLNLSANTKANMHADVQAGKTIVTPNTFLQSGPWHGLVYASMNPNGTGTYAIGEQTQQNGGWTVVSFGSTEVGRFVNEGTEDNFIYEDKMLGNDRKCRIARTAFLDIIANNPGYDAALHGLPCLRETKTYGLVSHTYILATHGAKFYSPNRYNYWTTEGNAYSVIWDDKDSNHIKSIEVGLNADKFKFNTLAGTYSWAGYEDDGLPGEGPADDPLTAYYQPHSNTRGYGRVVYGDILSQLDDVHYDTRSYLCGTDSSYCTNLNKVVHYLGYPTNNRQYATESTQGTNGQYQDFIGGQIYLETDYVHEAYYVPGILSACHNTPSLCNAPGSGGTGGSFGFPIKNPIYDEQAQLLFQDFEDGRINAIGQVTAEGEFEWVLQSQYIVENNEEYWEGFWDILFENGIYGVAIDIASGVAISKAVTKLVEVLGKKYPDKLIKKAGMRFIPLVGWGFLTYSVVTTVDKVTELHGACTSNIPVDDRNPSYFCGQRDAAVALVALGIISEQKAGALLPKNLLGAGSLKAIKGKFKLYQYVDDNSYNAIIDGLSKRELKHARTKFFEVANDLDDINLQKMGKDGDLVKGLVSNRFDLSKGEMKSVVEIKNSGIKISPKEVRYAGNASDGKKVFFETGRLPNQSTGQGGTGWLHIFEEIRPETQKTRFEEFKDAGIVNTQKEMEDLIGDIVETGTPGGQSNNLFYAKHIQNKDIKVGVSNNGFIITITEFNP